MAIKKLKTDPNSIEQNLQALETLVQAMEAKELTLEEAMKLFEEGIALSKVCQKLLTEAEQKVVMLMATAVTKTENIQIQQEDNSEDIFSPNKDKQIKDKNIAARNFETYDDDDLPF